MITVDFTIVSIKFKIFENPNEIYWTELHLLLFGILVLEYIYQFTESIIKKYFTIYANFPIVPFPGGCTILDHHYVLFAEIHVDWG